MSDLGEEQLINEHKLFEEAPVSKAFVSMVIPTIVSQIITVLYNLADTWFLGLTGDSNAVAAVSLCLPIYTMMSGFSNLFGIGGASLIARCLGCKDIEGAKKAFCVSIWSSLCIAFLYSLIIFSSLHPLLMLIGGDEGSIQFAKQYALITIVIAGIPTILTSTVAHLIRSTGEAKIASFGMTLGAILNIVLDPIFMFVILPKGNEVIGAGIATAFSNFVSIIFFIGYLIKHENGIYTVKPILLKNSLRVLKIIVLCGLPGCCLVSMAMLSNVFLNGMLTTMGGGAAIAGIGIVRKIDSLAYAVNQGITQGILPVIAYCYSANLIKRMKSFIIFSSLCTIVFSMICSVISYLFAPNIIRFFINDSQTIKYGAEFLRVMCIAVAIYPLTFVIIAIFQAVGKSMAPFIISLIHKGSIDIILFFIIRALYGVRYIIWASPIMDAVALVIAVIMVLKLFRELELKNQKIKAQEF